MSECLLFSILYADIVNFTTMASDCTAPVLVRMLHELVGKFEQLAQASLTLPRRPSQWRNYGGGGRGGQLPRAQQTRGRKTASPKILLEYFNDHKSEFDKVCRMSQQ